MLDLFAGSGALGIEALSRGAARAVFVERDAARAARAARPTSTRSGSAPSGATCAAATRSRRSGAHARRGETYDLVFLDPPYRHATGWDASSSAALAPVLAPAARVVVESDRRAPLELDLHRSTTNAATATP